MRQAILIRKSLSVAFLGTSILCHSGNLKIVFKKRIIKKKGTRIDKNRQLKNTLEASGVGRSTILPNSLSSRANIPSASAKSFSLT